MKIGIATFLDFWGLEEFDAKDFTRVFHRKHQEWISSRKTDDDRSTIISDRDEREEMKSLIAEVIEEALDRHKYISNNGKN